MSGNEGIGGDLDRGSSSTPVGGTDIPEPGERVAATREQEATPVTQGPSGAPSDEGSPGAEGCGQGDKLDKDKLDKDKLDRDKLDKDKLDKDKLDRDKLDRDTGVNKGESREMEGNKAEKIGKDQQEGKTDEDNSGGENKVCEEKEEVCGEETSEEEDDPDEEEDEEETSVEEESSVEEEESSEEEEEDIECETKEEESSDDDPEVELSDQDNIETKELVDQLYAETITMQQEYGLDRFKILSQANLFIGLNFDLTKGVTDHRWTDESGDNT